MDIQKKPSENLIKDEIRAKFPFRDKNGNPAFRKGQAKNILRLVKDVFFSDKKFIGLEAPVGAGKSPINYDVAMSVISLLLKDYYIVLDVHGDPKKSKSAVMLTSMKVLQDQIAAENWPEIKSLKGKSGYACSHCQATEVCTIRANYEGEDVSMCNNSGQSIGRKPFSERLLSLRRSIVKMTSEASETALRAKTNFKDINEFDELFKRIVMHFMRIYKDETSLLPEDRSKFYQKLMSPKECIERTGNVRIIEDIVDMQALDSISCNMRGDDLNELECGAKSAKVLSNVLSIRLLNPDIFYYLTRQPSSFSDNSLMIIDESHGWPSVMNRIFDMNIPVEMLRDVYGIDLLAIYKLSSQIDIMNHLFSLTQQFGKVNCAIKTVLKLGKLMGIRYQEHIDLIAKGKTEIVKVLANFAQCWFIDNPNGEFDLFNLLDDNVFRINDQGKYHSQPFFKIMRDHYLELLDKNDIVMDNKNVSLKVIKVSILKWVGRDINLNVSRETKSLFGDDHGLGYLSENIILGSYLRQLRLFFDDYFRICGVIGISNSYKEDPDNPGEQIFKSSAFGVYKKVVDGTTSLHRTSFDKIPNYEKKKKVRMLSLCVVDPGKIARIFFYSKADKVIFTSGTWNYMESTLRSLGIREDEISFHRMDSTFPKERRPIYIVERERLTDFSAKNEEKTVYLYKTNQGAQKFIGEVKEFVAMIKAFALENYKINPNIIIHSHSFILTKLMLEFGEFGPEWRFHTGGRPEYIRNRLTSTQFETHVKDEVIELLKKEHDKGYVFVSPSITEGISMDFGAARFQIILKFPIPNMVDPHIQTIMRGSEELGIYKDEDYVDRLIYTTLGQMYGRVMRSPDDWGFTFMFDQQIPKRLKWACAKWNNKKRLEINNPYFFEAIKHKYGYKGSALFLMPFLYK